MEKRLDPSVPFLSFQCVTLESRKLNCTLGLISVGFYVKRERF
ncbi:MAG: hypothetical protein ACR5K5_04080 [Wolbachia sp.]